VIDDHSRYKLALQACTGIQTGPVVQHLTAVFQRYGLPLRINTDNGAPFGMREMAYARGGMTPLIVWSTVEAFASATAGPGIPKPTARTSDSTAP
jgi:hypothetical protein